MKKIQNPWIPNQLGVEVRNKSNPLLMEICDRSLCFLVLILYCVVWYWRYRLYDIVLHGITYICFWWSYVTAAFVSQSIRQHDSLVNMLSRPKIRPPASRKKKKRKHDTENAAAGKEKNFCWFTRAGIVYSEFFRVFPHSVLGGCPSGEEAIMSSILMPSPPPPPKTHLPQTVIPIRGILTQSWGFRGLLDQTKK